MELSDRRGTATDMNALVGRCRSVLFGMDGVGFRLPGWLGVLAGYGFDVLAKVSGKKLPISSIRVKKFMGTTAFNTSISKTGFIPSCKLEDGIERTLRYEFIEDHTGDKLFFSE